MESTTQELVNMFCDMYFGYENTSNKSIDEFLDFKLHRLDCDMIFEINGNIIFEMKMHEFHTETWQDTLMRIVDDDMILKMQKYLLEHI
jgi:hypothetical protein